MQQGKRPAQSSFQHRGSSSLRAGAKRNLQLPPGDLGTRCPTGGAGGAPRRKHHVLPLRLLSLSTPAGSPPCNSFSLPMDEHCLPSPPRKNRGRQPPPAAPLPPGRGPRGSPAPLGRVRGQDPAPLTSNRAGGRRSPGCPRRAGTPWAPAPPSPAARRGGGRRGCSPAPGSGGWQRREVMHRAKKLPGRPLLRLMSAPLPPPPPPPGPAVLSAEPPAALAIAPPARALRGGSAVARRAAEHACPLHRTSHCSASALTGRATLPAKSSPTAAR